ncbi:MAG: GHKL domain-containing protein [Candidatus Nanopelagicaceae bacterium]|nr:GHKL domain-containing protein [Candidatus Nanopelagicaceae bacterium]
MALARRKIVKPEGSRNELSSGVIAVLETLDSASVVLAPGDAVLYSSPAALQIGLIKDGRLFGEELLALIRVVRRTDQSQDGNVEIPRGPVGEGVKNLHVKVTPLGNEGFILVLADDVSEADRIDAVRRDFVANISHELKTPIGALSILSEAVLQASDDPAMVKHFAAKMGDTANRLTQLVQQIISLSRLQDADPLTDATAVDISTAVKSAVDQSQTNADARGIFITLDAQIEANVFGGREQLVMAFHNLIENAINYSPEKTKVIISVRVIEKLVEIVVKDQGIGIAERDQERIFERFYRVDPARSRETGGTGLGLSIVKHVVANHGGDISVWSQMGEGSTFTLRLPLAEDDLSAKEM